MLNVANRRFARGVALAISVCWVISCGPALAANLITNGGFESGDFTGWTVNNAGWGQYVAVTGAFTNANSPFGGGGAAAPYEGNSLAAIGVPSCCGGPGEYSQAIPTIPGDNYTFSFAYFMEPAGANNDPSNVFTAMFGSSTPLNDVNDQSFTFDGNGNINWVHESYTVQATSNLTTVAFFSGNTQWGNGLDAVSVTFLSPEPSSVILLSVAAAGLAFAARRRKSNVPVATA